MDGFTVSVDSAATRRDLERLTGRSLERAIAFALNRTIKSVAAESSRLIRTEITMKAPAVKKRLRVGKARTSDLTARLTVGAKPSPLTDFAGTRQVRLGVSVKIKQRGGRKVIRGAFLTRFKSGRFTAATREIRDGRRVGRLPIRQLLSTSPAAAVRRPLVLRRLEDHALERFGIEFARETKRLLS